MLISYLHLSKTQKKNLIEGLAKVKAWCVQNGMRSEDQPAILDLGGSKVQVGIGEAPCLTRARGKTKASSTAGGTASRGPE